MSETVLKEFTLSGVVLHAGMAYELVDETNQRRISLVTRILSQPELKEPIISERPLLLAREAGAWAVLDDHGEQDSLAGEFIAAVRRART